MKMTVRNIFRPTSEQMTAELTVVSSMRIREMSDWVQGELANALAEEMATESSRPGDVETLAIPRV
jgi:hypothetical protein